MIFKLSELCDIPIAALVCLMCMYYKRVEGVEEMIALGQEEMINNK